MAVEWKTKLTWNTGINADSVEWCPIKKYTNVLVCGTYQYDEHDEEDRPNRVGRIYLFNIDDSTTSLHPEQTIDTPGILDQKWCYHTILGHPVLAVVTSEGFVQLYKLVHENDGHKLQFWIKENVGESKIALSVDWSTNKHDSNEPMLVVSTTDGCTTILKLVNDTLHTIGKWKGHDYEAWIASFNYWDPNIFYSGGDDCCFKSYDIRVPGSPTTFNRSYDAGVTSIRSNIEVEHQLITGSYDERVRLWDARNFKKPLSLKIVNGGVWRLKWHPYRNNAVLAACMYGGYRTLNLENQEINVTSEYKKHDSIAYGADWKFDEATNITAFLTAADKSGATTYDKRFELVFAVLPATDFKSQYKNNTFVIGDKLVNTMLITIHPLYTQYDKISIEESYDDDEINSDISDDDED